MLSAWRRSWIRRRASRGLLVVVVKKVNIYDPVAGGAALVVIDVGKVNALAVFKDPATGEPRLACVVGGRCAYLTRSRVARRCLCSM